MKSVEEQYKPFRLNQSLFEPYVYKSWFLPSFLQLLDLQNNQPNKFIRKETHEVYSFKIFSHRFLTMLNKEIENFYSTGIEAHRPNSMNNYGIILNDIGMKPMLDKLQETCVIPIAKYLFPGEYSENIVDHHTFVVKYNANEDVRLDMHTDDSDITFNVCLGNDFKGSTLSFCGNSGDPDHRKFSHTYHHEIGRAVIHLGNRRHGADDIVSGTRMNLVSWCRSSTRPQKKEYQKESSEPDKICLSFTHDKDYEKYKEMSLIKPSPTAWCPPSGKEFL